MVDGAAVEVKRGRRARSEAGLPSSRRTDYRRLRNPFIPQPLFSEDRIAAIHDTALRVLEELGLKVLLPEARALYRAAGASVDEDERNGAHRPRYRRCGACVRAEVDRRPGQGAARRDLTLEPGALSFLAGSGAPNVTDLDRGRRAGHARRLRGAHPHRAELRRAAHAGALCRAAGHRQPLAALRRQPRAADALRQAAVRLRARHAAMRRRLRDDPAGARAVRG